VTDARYIRSIMFTPATRVDRLPKARETGADVCLLDLEDSVGGNDKDQARDNLCEYLSNPKPSNLKLAVRINSLESDVGMEDILAIRSCYQSPDYIVVPKAECRDTIIKVENMLGDKADNTRFIALIESILGLQHVDEIAGSSKRLCGLMLGSADYCRSISAEICWDTLLFPRTMLVLAASKNKLAAIDTPYFDIPDLDGLSVECEKVKKLGFTGRCSIHPKQVEVINRIFSYSTNVIERSRKIVEAARESNGNICIVDGQMVGKPIIEQARAILASSEAEGRL